MTKVDREPSPITDTKELEGRRAMTAKTLALLASKKEAAERTLVKIGRESSGHQWASLHDDASTENEKNLANGTIQRIGNLGDVFIIEPRKNTENVGIGNLVTIGYEDDDAEQYHLLSPDDASWNRDLHPISYLSPLGVAILGRAKGDTVAFEGSNKTEISAKIVDIQEGQF